MASDEVKLEAARLEPECAAWMWLEGEYLNVEAGHDPNDRDYSADEMVNAFMAGMEARPTPPVEGKVTVEQVDARRECYSTAVRDLAKMDHISEALKGVLFDCADLLDAKDDEIARHRQASLDGERLRETKVWRVACWDENGEPCEFHFTSRREYDAFHDGPAKGRLGHRHSRGVSAHRYRCSRHPRHHRRGGSGQWRAT